MVKAVAAGAVLVAAGLPVAIAGTAGAATGPTLYCSQGNNSLPNYTAAGTAYCGSMPYTTQNNSLDVYLSGANFAYNAGTVSATTTATGVTVTSATELNANVALVQLSVSGTTPPGYYPLTLTDSNGSATLNNAFGVDPSATVTNVSPSSVPEGSATLVTITGTGLTSGMIDITNFYGYGSSFTVTGGVANAAGTSLTFYVGTLASTAIGTYAVHIPGVTTTNSQGDPGVDINVVGATITSISPSQLGHVGTTMSQNITVSGAGFVAGAVVRLDGNTLPYTPSGLTTPANELQFGAATVVNSTTITIPVTILGGGTGVTTHQFSVTVTNPNGTSYTAANALGWLTPGAAGYTAGSGTLTLGTNSLAPGSTTITFTGSPAFPLSAGDVVTLTYQSFSFSGTVISVGAGNVATAKFYLPQYLSTKLTSAVVAGATSLPVASLAGISSATQLTFVDATGENAPAVVNTNPVTNTVTLNSGVLFGHAAGTSVEFPIQSVTGWTMSVNNGASTLSLSGLSLGAPAAPSASYMQTDGVSNALTLPANLAPGTYTFLYKDPGANFASTGATVTFATSLGANVDGITGTLAVTSPDTAWVTVKFPATSSTPTYAVIGGTTVGAATSAGQTSLPVNTVAGLVAGGTYRLNNNGANAENVTISPTWDGVTNPIPLTAAMGLAHANGESISSVSYTTSVNTVYQATINNGNGQLLLPGSNNFATTKAANFTLTGMAVPPSYTAATSPGYIIGAGASGVSVNITGNFSAASGNKYDYVVTSTTPGVTFGPVTGYNAAGLTTTMSVAAGTPVNTSVQFTVTELNGQGTVSLPTAANPNSGVLIGNTPTITGVTGLPASMVPGESATFTVTGTLFDNSTLSSVAFLADSGNLAGTPDSGSMVSGFNQGGIVVSGCVLNSSTSITCTVTVNGDATNGAHDIMISNSSNGSATFAKALTVVNATIGAVSPTTYEGIGTQDTFVLTGLSGLTSTQGPGGTTPAYKVETFNANGSPAGGTYTYGGTGTYSTWLSSTSVAVIVPTNLNRPPMGTLVISLYQAGTNGAPNIVVDAPAISLGEPLVTTGNSGFSQPAGTSGAFAISAADSGLSGTFAGNTTFQPGATVSVVPATNGLGVSTTAGISVSGVTVLPGLITGTITVSGSTPGGYYELRVLNPDGGVAYALMYVSPAPTISAVNGVSVISGPVSFLSGTKTSLIIAGSNLQDGAVVSASVPGDATFGTATANAGATVLTVPVTFTSFTGATPVVLDLTVTNPDGGVATVTGEIILNPQPSVTGGPYYVPTFTTNKQLVVTGTGFEAGMTVASSNADYTVSVANVTPTAVTLLVSTNSNATSGTNTTLTFTNPDGGTTTMTLNGGPVPKPAITALKLTSAVWTGKTTTTHIIGSGFYGQPSITSNVGGTKVGVSGDTGTVLTIHVTVAKTTPRGVHTFTLHFKNGDVVRVKYNQR